MGGKRTAASRQAFLALESQCENKKNIHRVFLRTNDNANIKTSGEKFSRIACYTSIRAHVLVHSSSHMINTT